MNSLRRMLSSDSLLKVLVLGAALPSAVISCGEPDKPPAEAAFSISQNMNPSPAAGELSCAASMGRLMFPAQDGILVLSSTTPETTVLNTMTLMVNGKEGSTVSCSVHQTGDTSYEVSASITEGATGGQYRLTGVTVVDQFSTSANLSWQYQFDGNYTGPCAINVDTRGDGSLFIEPGTAKLTYTCQSFKNRDNQTCLATGTIFLQNCGE